MSLYKTKPKRPRAKPIKAWATLDHKGQFRREPNRTPCLFSVRGVAEWYGRPVRVQIRELTPKRGKEKK